MQDERYFHGYKLCSLYGSSWVRIFYHYSKNKNYFSADKVIAANEVYFINTTDRFSVIGSIDERFYIGGVYNFMIYYPDELPDSFFIFNQSSHPLKSYTVTDFKSNVTRPSKCIAFDTSSYGKLNGLALSNQPKSLIDGNPNIDNWHYPIGSASSYNGNNDMPGPQCFLRGESSTISVYMSELWIKFNSYEILSLLPSLTNSIFCQVSCHYYCTFKRLLSFTIFILLDDNSN